MTSSRFTRVAGPGNSARPSGPAAHPPLVANARARTTALHRPPRAASPALDDLLGLVDSGLGDLLGLTERDVIRLFDLGDPSGPGDRPEPGSVRVSRDNAGHHPRPRRRPPGDSRRTRPGDTGA
ncbi:hypothetical protein [Symbioplanes lichenis]|uniref:hypothetical protein n=1 Tax=Symbioplanes lichenis TaxID=1629072 RepID=UPI002739EF79|nr:hypothetical protein [Actinoplanes lichenis]